VLLGNTEAAPADHHSPRVDRLWVHGARLRINLETVQ